MDVFIMSDIKKVTVMGAGVMGPGIAQIMALAGATELPATKERDEIILFVRNAKRGIIRGYV